MAYTWSRSDLPRCRRAGIVLMLVVHIDVVADILNRAANHIACMKIAGAILPNVRDKIAAQHRAGIAIDAIVVPEYLTLLWLTSISRFICRISGA